MKPPLPPRVGDLVLELKSGARIVSPFTPSIDWRGVDVSGWHKNRPRRLRGAASRQSTGTVKGKNHG